MERRASGDWPRLLTPAPGCYPPAAAPRRAERVLHLALYPEHPRQASLARALASLGSYTAIDWIRQAPAALPGAILAAAQCVRPTLVFAQLQGASAFTPAVAAHLRAVCDPDVVMVNWDGDMHFPPDAPERRWFVQLGQVLDASLTTDTHFQARYAELGVVRPGYLGVGVADQYRAAPVARTLPELCFLAVCNPQLSGRWEGTGYARRFAAVAHLAQRFPRQLAIYGYGWGDELAPCVRTFVQPRDEAAVYAATACALSISISNAIRRYSSARLFNALGSGSLVLLDRFPDLEGLGLVDGVNCRVWSSYAELADQVAEVLAEPDAPRWRAMRAAAAALGLEHTWAARLGELQAILDTVRAARLRRAA
jgi:hypothetical protein